MGAAVHSANGHAASAPAYGAAAALAARMVSARLYEVQAQPGVWVQLDTPSQFAAAQMLEHMRAGRGDELSAALAAVARGWRGVTQAMLVGAADGTEDPAPFSAELLRMWLADRPEQVHALAIRALQAAADALQRAEASAKN